MKGVRPCLIAAACLLQALIAPAALAAPGDLDPTFSLGGDGVDFTGLTGGVDGGFALAIQPDGKIVTAGGAHLESLDAAFAVVRHDADGYEDDSFGYEGTATVNVTRQWDAVFGIAIQSDGKIVLAGDAGFGSGNSKFGLVRYNPNGKRDRTYGTVITDFTRKDDSIAAAAIEPDDDVVVVGAVGANGRDPKLAVARYRPDGTLDTTFGTAGLVKVNLGRRVDWANAVALQPDGKIVVAGVTSGRRDRIAVLRFQSDGTLDPSFAGDGIRLTPIGEGASAQAVAIQSDGTIVVAGTFFAGGHAGFAILRYLADGRLDASFGGDGIATTTFPDADAHGWGLAIQPDGKAVVVGDVLREGHRDHVTGLVRYLPDGTRDASFGTEGRVILRFRQGDEFVSSIGIDSTGNIVVAGVAGRYFVLARVLA